MYGLRDTPAPIEKIRKAQWTVENTRRTQGIVDELQRARDALEWFGLKKSPVDSRMKLAMERFKELDPKVRLPWE